MKSDTLILILFLMIIATLVGLVMVVSGNDFCFPVQGIDHNGKNEPFTVFFGWC
jgi:hypothetical protein